MLDALPQLLKHFKRFAFVFLFGVFLRIAAQMDALTQIVHIGQVFAPFAVDDVEQHIALKLLHRLGAHQRHFVGVFLLHLCHQPLLDVVRVQRVVLLEPIGHRNLHIEIGGQLALQRGDVPLLFHGVRRDVTVDQIHNRIAADFGGQLGHIGVFQNIGTLVVNHFALIVGHVVVFQHLFAHIEVAVFHFALGAFDLAVEQTGFDGHAALGCQAVEDGGGAIQGKQAQQGVFKREVETAGTGIALAPGAAAQLVVDTAAFVAFGADDVQTACGQHFFVFALPVVLQCLNFGLFFAFRQPFVGADGIDLRLDVAAQYDVGTAPGHIGGHGNHARLPGLRHNIGFTGVFFGVEHVVVEAFFLQQG